MVYRMLGLHNTGYPQQDLEGKLKPSKSLTERLPPSCASCVSKMLVVASQGQETNKCGQQTAEDRKK